MADIEQKAHDEVSTFDGVQRAQTFTMSVAIVFGQYAEDKEAAISYRDQYLLPALLQGKRVELDFKDVKTAPHSFINALLATPVKRLGVKAYQRIKVINAPGFIHEIIDTVLEHNVPSL